MIIQRIKNYFRRNKCRCGLHWASVKDWSVELVDDHGVMLEYHSSWLCWCLDADPSVADNQ